MSPPHSPCLPRNPNIDVSAGNESKMDKTQTEKLLPINEIDSENEHSMA